MSLIIEITGQEEARIEAAAKVRGIAPEDLARELIAGPYSDPLDAPRRAGAERHLNAAMVAKIRSMRGSMAHVANGGPLLSDDLHHERQADRIREEALLRGEVV